MSAMNWNYCNPVDVRFGPRSLAQLPALTAGRSVAAVMFPEARAVGVLARLESLLGTSLVQVIDRTESNPDVASLATLYESFWATTAPAEVIVAVGGGSVIDTAKALMIGTDDRRFASLIALLAGGKPFVPHA
ncbi:MAG: iron-containing alcohol dehydrogenase, partial [Casimicrobiaceae bacterium]